MLGYQVGLTSFRAEGTMWAAGRSLPGMSLAFALMAAINRLHRLPRHAVARAVKAIKVSAKLVASQDRATTPGPLVDSPQQGAAQ